MSFEEFVEPGKRSREPGPKKRLELWRERAKKLIEEKAFGAFGPSELVGLYAELHQRTYGVDALELVRADVLKSAAGGAARLIREQFNGEQARALEFVWWIWRRETKREKQRRAEGFDGGRIGWRLMFLSKALVVDYQVDRERRAAGGRGRR